MRTKFLKWLIAVIVISITSAIIERTLEFVKPESQEAFQRANDSFVESLRLLDPQKITHAWFEALYGVKSVRNPSPFWTEAVVKWLENFKAAAEPIIAGGPLSIVLAVVILLTGFLWVGQVVKKEKTNKFAASLVGYMIFTLIYGATFVKVLLTIVIFIDQIFTPVVHLAATIVGTVLTLGNFGFIAHAILKEREHHLNSEIINKVTNLASHWVRK